MRTPTRQPPAIAEEPAKGPPRGQPPHRLCGVEGSGFRAADSGRQWLTVISALPWSPGGMGGPSHPLAGHGCIDGQR